VTTPLSPATEHEEFHSLKILNGNALLAVVVCRKVDAIRTAKEAARCGANLAYLDMPLLVFFEGGPNFFEQFIARHGAGVKLLPYSVAIGVKPRTSFAGRRRATTELIGDVKGRV
jgi:hypothetical protein